MKASEISNDKLIKEKKRKKMVAKIKNDTFLYLLILPTIILTIIFAYLPMPGLIMAFMEYDVFKGFLGSPWVGFENFKEIFDLPAFWSATKHTLTLSLANLVIAIPIPVVFALLLNEIRCKAFKRVVQTVSYLPHFLSWIAIIGISTALFSVTGIVNDARVAMGGEGTERIMFLAKQNFFVPHILVLSLWKSVGWNSIIYLSTISGIDPELYEAAACDGAGKFRQCLAITIPSVLPTAILMLIIKIGALFSDNFDLVYGLQNTFIDYETIGTLVYKWGIQGGEYSLSTAIGLMQSVIGFALVIMTNYISKKVNDVALW